MHSLGFGDRWTGQGMIFGSRTSIGKKAFDDLVDNNTVLGMHADQPAALACSRHRPKDRRVIREEHSGVSHKELKARYALIHEFVHLFLVAVFELGRDEVKAIVD